MTKHEEAKTEPRRGRRSSAGVRLAGFVVLLAAVFGVAALAGGAVGPGGSGADESAHSEGSDEMSMESRSHETTGHGAMEMAPAGLAIAADGYRIALDRTVLPTGEPQTLSFRIFDEDGGVVRDFDDEHGALLHLIVARRDLTGYQHLHPDLGPDGTWSVRLELPRAGAYRAYADFETAGHSLTLGVDLFAPGNFDPRPLPAPATVAKTDGYSVELDDEGGKLHFTVSRHGAVVTDLQRYLGARGHLVALREGDLAYLHVHPEDAEPGDPGITFHAELPTAGRYRLFLQFRHDDRVHTVAFTREVSR